MPRPQGWTPTTPIDDVNLNANTKDVIGDLDSLNSIHFPNSDLVSAINAVPSMMNKTFYVDSINGNDSNDGSNSAPFQTIKKAIGSVPIGGKGVIKIIADTNVVISETNIHVYNKYLQVKKQGDGNVTIQRRYDISYDMEVVNSLITFFSIDFQGKPKTAGVTYDYNWVANIRLKNSAVFVYNSNISIDNGSFITGVDNRGYASVFLYNCNITTTADSVAVFKLTNDAGMYVFKGSSSIDDTSKHISGIIKDANGVPRNIISNIVL